MDSLEATISAIVRTFDYKTRSSRSEYWWFFLLFILCFAAFMRYDYLFPQEQTRYIGGMEGLIHKSIWVAVPILYSIFLLVFSSLNARRLHDLDKSGWYSLGFIVGGPFGFLTWLAWFMKAGTSGPNRFGPNPLVADDDY